MSDRKVMILEGANGLAFFLQEALLGEGLTDRVDLVNSAQQAIDLIAQVDAYQLIIIDLNGTWEQGMELGFWLNQRPPTSPVIMIVPPDTSPTRLAKIPFTVLSTPLSLNDFTRNVRQVLLSDPLQ